FIGDLAEGASHRTVVTAGADDDLRSELAPRGRRDEAASAALERSDTRAVDNLRSRSARALDQEMIELAPHDPMADRRRPRRVARAAVELETRARERLKRERILRRVELEVAPHARRHP